eukprot:gene3782-702_t
MGWLQGLTFTFLEDLLKLGSKEAIEEHHLSQLDFPGRHAPKELHRKFCGKAVRTASTWGASRGTLMRTFWNCPFGKRFLSAGLVKFPQDMLVFIAPILMRQLLLYCENTDTKPLWVGLCIAGTRICLTGTLLSPYHSKLHAPDIQLPTDCCHFAQYYVITYGVGLDVRTTVSAMAFEKITMLTHEARASTTRGQLLNFVSADAQSMCDFFPYSHNFWSAPMQTLIGLIGLWMVLGFWPVLSSMILIVIMVPANKAFATKLAKFQGASMKCTDQRVQVAAELVHGIRVVKYFNWISYFEEKVTPPAVPLTSISGLVLRFALVAQMQLARKQEHHQILKGALTDGAGGMLWQNSGVLLTLTGLLVSALVYGKMPASVLFPAVLLYRLIAFPLAIVGEIIGRFVRAGVSFRRFLDFLQLDSLPRFSSDWDMQSDVFTAPEADCQSLLTHGSNDGVPCERVNQTSGMSHDPCEGIDVEVGGMDATKMHTKKYSGEVSSSGDGAVQLFHASFTWGKNEDAVVHDLSLEISPGSLVMIVGPVGAGKSSLLYGLFGDIQLMEGGKVDMRGSVAYASQEAWIRNASVRDNVLGGAPFEESRFWSAISCCGLEQDLQTWPGMEDTEVGERGVMVSGGQRMRLSLARAVYMDRDIYLLDAPLRALDMHVGAHVWKACIHGALAGRTSHLVTHTMHHLPEADTIVLMDKGQIVFTGTYADLVALYKKDGGQLSEALHSMLQDVVEGTVTSGTGIAAPNPHKAHDVNLVPATGQMM